MILVENVVKSFGQQKAVDGLNFEVAAGETLGLLGPNGAGKTTTINMLVGLLVPDQGRVALGTGGNGMDSSTLGDPQHALTRKLLGVAPQSLSLYDELTANENLKFFGSLYGLAGSALTRRVDWALEFAELKDRRNDRVGTYSGGMKRRLNIAVGLIHEPRMLLLDEPTVGVDPHSRNHIFESIVQLQDRGMTIIYTTHYMEEAQRLCDRVAIVDHGKLLDIGTVDQLVQRHGGASVVTAELKSAPKEIRLPGMVENNQLRFESDQPLDEVAALSGQGVQFQTLNVTQPDLESVFLSLTGRSLRD